MFFLNFPLQPFKYGKTILGCSKARWHPRTYSCHTSLGSAPGRGRWRPPTAPAVPVPPASRRAHRPAAAWPWEPHGPCGPCVLSPGAAPLWLLPRTGGGGGRRPTGPLPQHCVPEGPGKGPTRGEDSSASAEGGDPKGAGAREGAVGWVRPGRGLSPHRPVGSFQQLQPLPGQVGPGGWGVEAGEGVLPAQPRSHAPAGPPAPQPRRAAQPGHRAAGQAEAAEEGAGVLHVLQPLRQVQPRRALPLHPRPREGGRVHQVTAGASRAGGPRLWPQQRLTPSSPSAQVRPGHVQED